MRKKTGRLWWAGAVATLALCLSGCTPWGVAPPAATPTATSSIRLPTPLPPLALSPTPTVAILPAPVASVLAPLPADCPTLNPPQTLTLTQPISVPQDQGTYAAGSILRRSAPVWLFTRGASHQN